MNKKTPITVFAFLEEVQKRPSMYLKDGNDLRDLSMLLHGYEIALNAHKIELSKSDFRPSVFGDWLPQKTGIEAALGRPHILSELCPDPDIAFAHFFELLNEFKIETTSDLNH